MHQYSCNFNEMESDETIVCRICLKICETGFEAIENDTQSMLDFVHLTLHLGVSHQPVICNSCLDDLKKCFDFKAGCLHKKDIIHYAYEDATTYDPSAVLVKENLALVNETFNSNGVCCLCEEAIGVSIVLTEEVQSLISVVETYLPEINLNVTKNPFCNSCYASLQINCVFISNCLNVEKTIEEYCKVKGTNNKGHIELIKVLSFVTDYKTRISSLNVIETKEEWELFDNNTIVELKSEDLLELEEHELCYVEDESIAVKVEEDIDRFEESVYSLESSEALAVINNVCVENHVQNHSNPPENVVPGNISGACVLDSKEDTSKHMLSFDNIPKATLFKCSYCTFSTIYMNALLQHMLAHRNASQTTTYKCSLCSYQSNNSEQVQAHLKTHQKYAARHKCEICAFRAKYKSVLRHHMQTHDVPSTAHKCGMCHFKTRHKKSLQRHILSHKGVELPVYKCERCTFQSNHKLNLQVHMLNHKTSSEPHMYKCEMCPYETKHIGYLRSHIVKHKSTTEVRMHKCDSCTYESKRKNTLMRHIYRRHSKSDDQLLSCQVCPYQTKHKRSLQLHAVMHKKVGKLTLYKCDTCTYESIHKGTLQRHMLRHRSIANAEVFFCDMCSFQTKYKSSLRLHVVKHKKSSKSA